MVMWVQQSNTNECQIWVIVQSPSGPIKVESKIGATIYNRVIW